MKRPEMHNSTTLGRHSLSSASPEVEESHIQVRLGDAGPCVEAGRKKRLFSWEEQCSSSLVFSHFLIIVC